MDQVTGRRRPTGILDEADVLRCITLDSIGLGDVLSCAGVVLDCVWNILVSYSSVGVETIGPVQPCLACGMPLKVFDRWESWRSQGQSVVCRKGMRGLCLMGITVQRFGDGQTWSNDGQTDKARFVIYGPVPPPSLGLG